MQIKSDAISVQSSKTWCHIQYYSDWGRTSETPYTTLPPCFGVSLVRMDENWPRYNTAMLYCETSSISRTSVGNENCWLLRCNWSIACRRCSNYILNLRPGPGFNILCKDNCKMRQETFKFWDFVRLILEIWQYIVFCLQDVVRGHHHVFCAHREHRPLLSPTTPRPRCRFLGFPRKWNSTCTCHQDLWIDTSW